MGPLDLPPAALGALLGGVAVAGLALLLARDRAKRRRAVMRRIRLALAGAKDGNLAARAVVAEPGELSAVVDELNASLAAIQARLAAQDELARSNRVLLNAIAHDLRTPMTSIAGYIQAIQGGIAPDRERALAIVARKTAEVGALIDNLFYLTRLQLGDVNLAAGPVDCAELARLALLSFLPRIEAAGIAVKVAIPESPCLALADDTAVSRILGNLIGNSLEHAHGLKNLGITVAPPTPGADGQWLKIEVVDDGCGIAPAVIAGLGRQASPLEGVGPGGGYGLAIAGALTKQLGGELTASSEPFVATRLTVTLPAA